MFDFEIETFEGEKYLVEVTDYTPAFSGSWEQPPEDEVWEYSVWDENGNEYTGFDEESLLSYIKAHWDMLRYNDEYDYASTHYY